MRLWLVNDQTKAATLWTDEGMRDALGMLERHLPGDVEDLASIGPMDEPLCGVCTVLVPYCSEERRFLGKQAAIYVVMYHDEATFDVDPEDYMMATGLAGVHVYSRCLKVYERARELVAKRQVYE